MHPDFDLKALFEPTSVAVIGASHDKDKVGHLILSNLTKGGYNGKIFPVNPKGGTILEIEVLASISQLPEKTDLAIICLPRDIVLDAVSELAERGVSAVIIVSAGFKETGREGYDIEEKLREVAEKNSMALLGPNCLGMINTSANLNASFAQDRPKSGSIAFFSQSGALCASILDWALGENIGFSKFISLGNKTVLNESHMLNALHDDPDTRVILGYCESLEDGQRLVRTAQKVTAKKPVIMIKAGTTPAGARATSSHTGAIAGSGEAFRAAFIQSGIIQANDLKTLLTLARSFASQPLPQGPNLMVVTNSGGPGILAADACENSSLSLARPSAETLEKLRNELPPYAALYNPVDIIGDADAERYRKTLEIVARDGRVHSILVVLSPTASVEIEETAEAVIEMSKDCDKPIFTCFMGGERIGAGSKMLLDAGIPCYPFPEPAIQAIEAMHRYYQWQNRAYPVDVCFRRDKGMAQKFLAKAKKAHQTEITDFDAQGLARAYELPIPETRLARTSDKAVRAAKQVGYPVVLKIASPHIQEKSSIQGVVKGLKKPAEVRKAFFEITSRAARLRPDAYISGCLVQAMAPEDSTEVTIGLKRDPQFGPLITFGLGGVHTEILHDFSYRLAPLTLNDAQEIVRGIKSFSLLKGVRGNAPVDIGIIEDILLTVSQMAVDFPEIQEALFHPVLVSEKGAVVTDMRMTIG